jgi:hypothetical protein
MPAISVTAPLDAAWRRMTSVLFRPFDIGKWFMLGFTAWLATLGEGGGIQLPSGPIEKLEETEEGWSELTAYLVEHASVIFTFAIAALAVGLAIAILILWLNARGRFMLIDNLAHDRALVTQPWREFRAEGHSLFLWNLAWSILGLILMVPVLGPLGLRLYQLRETEFAVGGLAGAIAWAAVSGLLVVLVMAGIQALTNDCVIAAMAKRRLTTIAAWRLALPAFRSAGGAIVLYLLFRMAMAMAVGVAVVAFGLLTCCCGFVLLAIPYIGSVVLLPVTVFVRFYSLEFVRQFGPDFDVLAVEPPPAPPAGRDP